MGRLRSIVQMVLSMSTPGRISRWPRHSFECAVMTPAYIRYPSQSLRKNFSLLYCFGVWQDIEQMAVLVHRSPEYGFTVWQNTSSKCHLSPVWARPRNDWIRLHNVLTTGDGS